VVIIRKSFYEARKINNFKDLLASSVELYGNKTAFMLKKNSESDESLYNNITYTHFKKDVDNLGTSLINLGLKGQKIAIISDNRYEWSVSYFAVTNGTGIVVPLDKLLPENEIQNLMTRSGASAVIYSEKFRDIMKKISLSNSALKIFIDMDLQASDTVPNDESNTLFSLNELLLNGAKLITEGNRLFLDAKINSEEMGIILYTSGTTHLAKGVMLSHKNICTNLMDVASVIKIYPDDVFLSFLPLHHTFESTGGFLLPIYSGASITYCEGVRQMAKNMKDAHISCMISVPILYESMYKKLWTQIEKSGKANKLKKAIKINNFLKKYLKIDLSRTLFKEIHDKLGGKVRLMVSGAAPIDVKVCEAFQDLGIKLVEGYGLTETSPLVSVNDDIFVRNGSTGKPAPSVDVKIVDTDIDGIGEIKVKAPSVMLGYYENPEATAEVMIDGWFHTGDLGYLDSDGYLFITGRKKNVIVLKNGKKIFPEEIETLIGRSDYVSEAFVYGKPDTDGDYKLCAKIVFNREVFEDRFGKEVSSEKINEVLNDEIKKINKTLPKYKYIKELIITEDELIKTTTRKIKRHEELKVILS
jgi:long-chain acyl-CoA synthetase